MRICGGLALLCNAVQDHPHGPSCNEWFGHHRLASAQDIMIDSECGQCIHNEVHLITPLQKPDLIN